MSDNDSWKYIEALALTNRHVAGMIERQSVNSHDAFVQRLHIDIDDVIAELERNRHLYQDHGEDSLTSILLLQLKAFGYDADHDTQHGGHCDLLIKHLQGRYEWIGEAKIWQGPAYIHGGFQQLTTRYATGTVNDNHGGMLLYVKIKNATVKLQDWKTYLQDNEVVINLTDEQNPLRFNSEHTIPSSGLPYKIRHMAVVLNHATTPDP